MVTARLDVLSTVSRTYVVGGYGMWQLHFVAVCSSFLLPNRNVRYCPPPAPERGATVIVRLLHQKGVLPCPLLIVLQIVSVFIDSKGRGNPSPLCVRRILTHHLFRSSLYVRHNVQLSCPFFPHTISSDRQMQHVDKRNRISTYQ